MVFDFEYLVSITCLAYPCLASEALLEYHKGEITVLKRQLEEVKHLDILERLYGYLPPPFVILILWFEFSYDVDFLSFYMVVVKDATRHFSFVDLNFWKKTTWSIETISSRSSLKVSGIRMIIYLQIYVYIYISVISVRLYDLFCCRFRVEERKQKASISTVRTCRGETEISTYWGSDAIIKWQYESQNGWVTKERILLFLVAILVHMTKQAITSGSYLIYENNN